MSQLHQVHEAAPWPCSRNCTYLCGVSNDSLTAQHVFVPAFCFFCLIDCSTTYTSVLPSNVTAIAAPSSTTLNVDQASRPVKLRAYYRVQPASRQPGRRLYAGPWTDIRHIKQQCRQPSCQVPPPYNDFVLQHCQGCTARQRHIIASAKAYAHHKHASPGVYCSTPRCVECRGLGNHCCTSPIACTLSACPLL